MPQIQSVLFDSSLSFKPQYEHVTQAATSMMAVASRFSRDAKNPLLAIKIFMCHVLPLLEYCFTVWNQDYIGLNESVERIFRKATKTALRTASTPLSPNYVSFPNRCVRLGLLTLGQRREIFTIVSAIKYLREEFRSELSSSIRAKLNPNRQTRLPNLFNGLSELPPKSPLAIMLRFANNFRNQFSLSDSTATIRNKLRSARLPIANDDE